MAEPFKTLPYLLIFYFAQVFTTGLRVELEKELHEPPPVGVLVPVTVDGAEGMVEPSLSVLNDTVLFS